PGDPAAAHGASDVDHCAKPADVPRFWPTSRRRGRRARRQHDPRPFPLDIFSTPGTAKRVLEATVSGMPSRRSMKHLSTLATLLALLAPELALAQDDLDLDEDPSGRQQARRSVTPRVSTGVVREIERGVYLKSNVGTTVF